MRMPAIHCVTLTLTMLSGLSALTGCACDEHVSVTNRASFPILVQLALPWPSYELFGSACHYEFQVMPNATWSTDRAAADDRRRFDIKPNGATIMRLFNTTAMNAPPKLFAADTGERAHLFIALDANGNLTMTGEDEAGNPIAVQETDSDWFRDDL